MKKTISWNPDLKVGVEIIDTQHKILFDLVNDLNNAVNNNAGLQVIDTMFAVITNYAFQHFAMEESYLADKSDFKDHCYKHYQLLKELNDYSIEYRNRRKVEKDPSDFLEDWLMTHIKECDIPSLASQKSSIDFDSIIDDLDSFETVELDKRQHKRIRYESVVDKKITGHCYNTTTLKNTTVTVVDLAVGGLKIYSDRKINIDDLLIISCNIGRTFKMREKVRVRNMHDNFYGVEFIAPKEETLKFLTQLYGATYQYR